MSRRDLAQWRGIGFNMIYNHTSDMTGGKLYFTVKSTKYDTVVDDSTATPRATVTSFTNGGLTASFTISDEDMYIAPQRYYYDLIYEDSTGLSYPPILEGSFKVQEHPTNRNTVNG